MLIVPAIILTIEDEDDRSYMEWIFHTYHRLMYRYIIETLPDSWVADDAMQECLIHLIDKIHLLRSLSETKRRNYIITTAKNTSISIFRRESKKRGCSYDDWVKDIAGTDSGYDPEELVLYQDEIKQFQTIWNDLDQRSQFILSSRYILEQSFEEIGKALDVTPGSARMMLTRAKRSAIELLRK